MIPWFVPEQERGGAREPRQALAGPRNTGRRTPPGRGADGARRTNVIDLIWRVQLATAIAILPFALAAGALGCGGEDGGEAGGQAEQITKPGKGAGRADRGQVGKGQPELKTYTKVEDVVGIDEAGALRQPFGSRDFAPDVSGTENRDPFRSYVVRQPMAGEAAGSGAAVSQTEVCTARNMVAPQPKALDPRARKGYSLRDLQLTGIVLRGTQSYAMFQDSSGFGHIVRRGDCLGKEKARVEKIGAGFVRLELVPEASPNQPERAPQKREILLHPEDLSVDEPVVADEAPQ